MAKKKVTKKEIANKVDLDKVDLLKPIDIELIGTNGDPCFGKLYNLATKQCKMCGDSELCSIVFAQTMGKTRDQLNAENNYKDMQVLIDIPAVKKYIRGLRRKEKGRREILDKVQEKFDLSREEAKEIYRTFKKEQEK